MLRKLSSVLCFAALHGSLAYGAVYLAGESEKNPLSYRENEPMEFRIDLLEDGKPLPGKRLRYFIDTDDGKKERGEAISGETLILKTSLSKSGFARVRVYPHEPDGKALANVREYDGGAGAGVEKIVAAEPVPAGFDAFWRDWCAKLKAEPAKAKLTRVPTTMKDIQLFEFEIPTLPEMAPATGFLAYPENAQKKSLPARLEFEGYNAPAPAGIPGRHAGNQIVIRVNRYGLPNRETKEFYESRKNEFKDFGFLKNERPEKSDFLGLFLRALRAADVAKSLPEFNGALRVEGGSMGAMQAIAVAALDPDVTECDITIPWSCDLGGVLHGRMRGWRPDPVAGALYFDPVYLARKIQCPVTVRAGLGDYVAPPSGVMAFYNALTGPAKITFVQNMKHGSGQHPWAGEFTLEKNQSTFSDADRQLSPMAGLPDLRKLGWRGSDSFCFTERRDGKTIFVVDVPKEDAATSHWFSAKFDPAPFRGKSVCFLVKFRTQGVTQSKLRHLGSKFMIVCSDGPESKTQFHDAWLPEGDHDWKYGSIFQTFGLNAKNAEIVLGMQDVSGRIEFELDSVECGALYTPENRTNLDYQIQYPDSVRNARLRGVMSPGGPMNEEMLQTLKSWNANLVRYQLIRNWGQMNTEMDLAEYNTWLDKRLDNLEEMTKLSPGYGIRFILDMHSPPGGKSGWYNMRMFSEKKYADAFVDCWKKIAERFKGNKAIFAYDLVNEPFQGMPSGEGYLALQQRAAEEIRKIDPAATVIVTSNEGGGTLGFAYLSPLPMENVIYQVHFYGPGEFTHQPAGRNIRYPGVIGGVKWDKEMLRKKLQVVRDFQLRHDAVIYVGEFSANVWAPGAEQWMADCIEIFEEYGWLWSFHAFREWAGWSVEHDGTGPNDLHEAPNTKRKQALLNGLKHNNKE